MSIANFSGILTAVNGRLAAHAGADAAHFLI
jgi:hypothetical protein